MTDSQSLSVGIIGCGLIGQKRAQNLVGAKLIATADLDMSRAEKLAQSAKSAVAYPDWQSLIERAPVDIVIVATTHNALAPITAAAIAAGKHVLVEKPAAISPHEIEPLIALANEKNVRVRVGFNHRYHPSFVKAREILSSGALGEMMFVRGRYGHGGRIGYEKEWRANPALSGGGELMDQGVHLIDLARVFLGDFPQVEGFVHTYFWDMPVDDNAFMMLRTEQQQTAWLHVSCSEWKNLFSFEVYGKDAKLHIEGLGGSYGVERLSYYKMLPEMGPPETTIYEYPGADTSWRVEFAEFLDDIRQQRTPAANLTDAWEALRIVERLYQDHQS